MNIGDRVTINERPLDWGDNGKVATIVESIPTDLEPIWSVEFEDGSNACYDESELLLSTDAVRRDATTPTRKLEP